MHVDLEKAFQLIQRQGTLEQVGTFLRGKKLPSSSGSWADMISTRLRPAYKEGKLDDADLLDLLRQTEEHGSQHIFFFELVPGQDILRFFDTRLDAALTNNGLPAIGTTSLVDMPSTPTVVEVRRQTGSVRSVVFKIVEKRAHLEKVSDGVANGQFVVTYDQIPYRAVNIMRIGEDGTAEIRIQSHSDATSYGGLSEAVFQLLAPVVNRLDWRDKKLEKFKENLFVPAKRTQLMTIFGLRQSQHSNVEGTRITAATGTPGSSMYDDGEAVATVDRFLKKKNHAHCERANITIKRANTLQRSINLVIGGEANELAITSKVSKSEYDYIVEKVVEFNQ